MKTLTVIPARGGSKGIPGKNIRPLGGKPLICYAIENALAVSDPADICISTDSAEIAAVAAAAGVPVPFMRPAELATDTASSYDVLLHALRHYENQGILYDRVLLLQPTSPFVRPEHIRGAMALWRDDIDMVVSVREAATNPYYNAFETDPEGYLHISKGDGTLTRRQDAPKVWEYNGAIYLMSAESLRRQPLSAFRRRIPYPMPADASTDLDTPLDWLVAETILSSRKNPENQK